MTTTRTDKDGWLELPRARGAVLLQGGLSVRLRLLHGRADLATTIREAEDLLGQQIVAELRDFFPIGQPLEGDLTGRFAYEMPIFPPTEELLHWLEGPCCTRRTEVHTTRNTAETSPELPPSRLFPTR
jgi:hypothetical protein